jgi:hypothetical protein
MTNSIWAFCETRGWPLLYLWTGKDTGHQKRFGRGFVQRVGELFSSMDQKVPLLG